MTSVLAFAPAAGSAVRAVSDDFEGEEVFDLVEVSRGVAVGDVDNDGRIDL